jgi:hypothetical protein
MAIEDEDVLPVFDRCLISFFACDHCDSDEWSNVLSVVDDLTRVTMSEHSWHPTKRFSK